MALAVMSHTRTRCNVTHTTKSWLRNMARQNGIVRSAVMGLSMSGEPSSAERCVICVSRNSIIRIRLAAKEISLDLVSTR